MPLSIPNHKFLLDENVKIALAKFLKDREFDIKLAPKGTTDSNLASISQKEKRILVTNDEDFQWYSKNQIYSVILLKIPQHDSGVLISSFEKLLKEFNNFSSRIVILEVNKWNNLPL